MTLGEFIKIKRKEKGISVWILAELCDVSGSYISLIETGKISNNPSEELIKKLAFELNLNERDKNIFYELYAEHVLPKIIKEKRDKELKSKKVITTSGKLTDEIIILEEMQAYSWYVENINEEIHERIIESFKELLPEYLDRAIFVFDLTLFDDTFTGRCQILVPPGRTVPSKFYEVHFNLNFSVHKDEEYADLKEIIITLINEIKSPDTLYLTNLIEENEGVELEEIDNSKVVYQKNKELI